MLESLAELRSNGLLSEEAVEGLKQSVLEDEFNAGVSAGTTQKSPGGSSLPIPRLSQQTSDAVGAQWESTRRLPLGAFRSWASFWENRIMPLGPLTKICLCLIAFAVLAAIGSGIVGCLRTEEAPVVRVPDLICSNLQSAQDRVERIGHGFLTESKDGSGGGRMQLWDRNWTVVDQSPKPGTIHDKPGAAMRLTLYVLKHKYYGDGSEERHQGLGLNEICG